MVSFNNSWDELLKDEFEKEYYLKIREFLKREYGSKTIYPSMYDIFNALKYTDYNDVKIVILGQDPYHGPNQAHGLSFSVRDGVAIPPSLKNIFKEMNSDIGFAIPNSGNLTKWAKNGVLLLNTTLTVEAGRPNSHKDIGWQLFTDRIIEVLNEREKPMVFMLWGANAKSKVPVITNGKHLILTAAHPSPFSAHSGFFGCKHFSLANKFIEENGMSMVDFTM